MKIERPSNLEFMQNPDLWPRWPLLPLKKRTTRLGDLPDFGILVCRQHDFAFYDESEPREFMLMGPPTKSGGPELLEELVNSGWRVD